MARAGLRVKIEYADQNEGFASCLPVTGQLSHILNTDNDPRPLWVVDLDTPLEYQLKVGEPHEYRLITTHQLVIGSRAEGEDIGSRQSAAVHILLPLVNSATLGQRLRTPEFYHAAWGMCRKDDAA